MGFNWRGYVLLAESLSSNTDEASLRSAISRAYYGAFCLSRNHFGLSNNTGPEVHKKVSEKYAESDDDEIFYAGQCLEELRKKRNDADYNGNYDITKEDIAKVVEKSKSIVKIIDDF